MTTTANRHEKNLDLASHIVRFRDGQKYNLSYISIIVLIIAALFFIEDIYIDIVVEGKGYAHVFLESGVFIGICLALALEIKHAMKLSSRVTNTEKEVSRLKRHLNELIHEEFDRWKLTKTEQDIAIMLIKGYSMLEIAELRSVKEKSVRQQATGIYSKANLSNRYELTSHFIEDLLAVPTS